MRKKIKTIIFWLLIVIVYIMSVIITAACDWFNIRFGVSFEEILFTITSPLKGSDVSFLDEAVEYIFPYITDILPMVGVLVLLAIILKSVIVLIDIRIKDIKIKLDLYKCYRFCAIFIVSILFINAWNYAFSSLDLNTYIARKLDKTTIYEDYYINPNEVTITPSNKNIIYLYLESMENTYSSKELGGEQEINYIPLLTELAFDNISFSNNEYLGGGRILYGTSWTMGALFSSTTGIPFSLPVNGNSMDTFENFAPGVTALGDMLENYGYNQVFLCGSDGNFAGRKNYFEQHGNYDVLDYYYAIEKAYIPKEHYVWWGYEDEKLYEIAKKELLMLAENEEPFNFTMLTVDTHHIDGYVCNICENNYDNQLANVITCADKQAYEFIMWCMEQDFYEDTVIFITGDHLRMDTTLVANAQDRRMYNCIINAQKEPKGNLKNREFTSLDYFPTVLSAMGFEIEGDRLGLGVDLFSGEKTLVESLGYDVVNNETRKYSKYYVDNFQ